MRVIIATTAVLAVASSAMAQTAPDRYGPARTGVQTASAAAAMAYGGRMLTWASKAQAAIPADQADQPEAEPQPQARPQLVPQPIAASPPREAARPAVAAAPPAPTPRAYHLGEVAQTPAPPAPAPPTSLYDTPPPARAAAAPPPATPPRIAPAPQQMAAAPARAPYAGAPSRLYSLHREYGMTPDPTPAATAGGGYVLIGPSGEAPASAASEDDKDKTPDRPF